MMPIRTRSRTTFVVVLLALAILSGVRSSAIAQISAPETAQPAPEWTVPEKSAVEEWIESVRGEINARTVETDSADAVREELERLLTVLSRQGVLLDELQSIRDAPVPTYDIPEDGPVTIAQMDVLRAAGATADSQIESSDARLEDARRAIEDAESRLGEARAALRAERDSVGPDAQTPEILLLEARVRVAEAEVETRRIERAVAQAELEAAESHSATIKALRRAAEHRVVFDARSYADRKAALESDKTALERKLTDARDALERADARLEQASARAQDRPDDPGAQAEAAARTLWRDAYRREVDRLSRAVERVADRETLWRVRFDLQNDSAYRESGEAVSTILDIRARLDRTKREVVARLDEARARQSRLASSEVEDPSSARWQRESQQALAHLVSVLEADRQRLNGAIELAASAQGDLERLTDARSLGDRFRKAWSRVTDLWNSELVHVEDRPITIGKLILGLLLLSAGFWIAKMLSALVARVLFSRLRLTEGAVAALRSVLFYLLLVTVVLTALRLINIPLTVFTVLGGALAIGIGFGSQNLMNNFISGLIILAERPVRVGDLIQIDELHGIVQHIGTRSTRVLTSENVDIIVPNSTFLETNVTNWTLTSTEVRTKVRVGVAYGSPTREVVKLMKKAAENHGRVLKKPAPIVLFEDFGNDALIFDLIFWVKMRRMMDRRQIESDLRLRINELFAEAGLVIAYPQRDVHLDTLKPLDIRVLSPGDAETDEDHQ